MDGWEEPSEADQERWAEDAEAAYQEAQRRIAKAKAEGKRDLDFGEDEWALPALSALPPDISELTNVSVLNLSDTHISDVSALSGLPALKSLSLSGTSVSDLSALSGLPALKHLYLIGTAVSDVSVLSGLPDLQRLYLNGTQISDVSALSGLPALKSLFLSSTQVSDLSVLSGLPALKFLDLNGTAVSDVSALSGLPALESLFLKGTSVSDVSALSGLTALKYLNLNSTAVSDLSPLSELSSLIDGAKKFDFYGLYYDNTPVAAQPVFSELVKLDTSERTIQTLQYLNGEHPVYGGPPPPVGGSEEPQAEIFEEIVRISAPADFIEVRQEDVLRIDVKLKPVNPKPAHASKTPANTQARDDLLQSLNALAGQIADSLGSYANENAEISNRVKAASQIAGGLKQIEKLTAAKGRDFLAPVFRRNIEAIAAGWVEDAPSLEAFDQQLILGFLKDARTLYAHYPVLAELDSPFDTDLIPDDIAQSADEYIKEVEEMVFSENGQQVFTQKTREVVLSEKDAQTPIGVNEKKWKLRRFGSLVGKMFERLRTVIPSKEQASAWVDIGIKLEKLWKVVAPYLGIDTPPGS